MIPSKLPNNPIVLSSEPKNQSRGKNIKGGSNKNRCKRVHYLGGGEGTLSQWESLSFPRLQKSRYEADDNVDAASQLSEAFSSERCFAWSKSRAIGENWGGDALPE